MSLLASYSFCCDQCGVDTGASRPTPLEARDYAEAGGWKISYGPFAYDLCGDCVDVEGLGDES